MTRVLQATRVQLLIWRRTQLLPWLALLLSLLVNIGVFAFTGPPASGRNITGGLATIYAFPIAFTLQSVTQTFPFIAGLGLTRWTFARSSALIVTAQAVIWGSALFLLSLLEEATGGFGESLYFFGIVRLMTGNPGTQLLIFIVPLMVSGLLGFFLGAVTKRFGLYGVMLLVLGLLVVGGLVAIGVSWQHDWTPITTWLGDRSAVTLVVGGAAVLMIALGGGGWGVLRRAVT